LRNFAPVTAADRRLRGLPVAPGSHFNFNKTKHICIPTDQADLALDKVTSETGAPQYCISQLPPMEEYVFSPGWVPCAGPAAASPLEARAPQSSPGRK
jgi:hypothetical protein